MRFAYICYWGVNDVLTVSSVFPTIEYLNQRKDISKIDLYTFERDPSKAKLNYILPSKVNLFQVREGKLSLFSKFNAFRKLNVLIRQEHDIENYSLTFGRSVFGGIAAYMFNKSSNVPFIIESFEPHANYMIDTKVWTEKSIKTKILNHYHTKIIRSDCYLITVSQNYYKKLLSEGVSPTRLGVIPCTVSLSDFARLDTDRNEVRKDLKIPRDYILAVYVGKFGGLYYGVEAFEFFAKTLLKTGRSKLLILSNQSKQDILSLANAANFPINRIIIKEVKHNDVSRYLSACDIAFATIKQFKSSIYSSAIKIGEYWANGLPLIITKGIGDDSKIVETENIGVVADISDDIDILEVMNNLSQTENLTSKIVMVANKYRSRKIIKEVLDQVVKGIL